MEGEFARDVAVREELFTLHCRVTANSVLKRRRDQRGAIPRKYFKLRFVLELILGFDPPYRASWRETVGQAARYLDYKNWSEGLLDLKYGKNSCLLASIGALS